MGAKLSLPSHALYPEVVTATQRPTGLAHKLLLVAAAIVLVEAATCLVLAVLGAIDLTRDTAGMGIGVALILAVYGLFQAWAAWRVTHGDSWARSPLVVTQLIQFIIAFNLADVPAVVTGLVGAAAVATLACLLAPPVTRALSEPGPV